MLRTRMSGRRRAAALVAATVLASLGALVPATALALHDALPDLRMLKPKDVQVVKYTSGAFKGHRLLRFTTTIRNEGEGPLSLAGSRDCMSLAPVSQGGCPTMKVRQKIRRSDGTWHSIATDAIMQYEVGDGHHHWHAVGLEQYKLWPLGVADPDPLKSAKFGFCFFDGRRWSATAPTKPKYVQLGPSSNPGCGTQFSLATRVGLSPGWADVYPWSIAGQYIDITGVPTGDYLLCVRADPNKRFQQSDTTNDEAWARMRIAGTKVTIRDSKRSSCSAERARWTPTAVVESLDDGTPELALHSVALASIATGTPRFLCRLL